MRNVCNEHSCGGRGEGGGEGLTFYIWHSMNVRAEWTLFQRCRIYDWPPFLNKKYMNDPIFLDSYAKGPTFLTSWYMYTFFAQWFFAQRFFEVACSLGIQWIDCAICLTTSNKWVQKIKGQYMNRSTFRMIKYINSVFSKARYMNGVGFEKLTRTPSPPPPPPAHTHTPPQTCRWSINYQLNRGSGFCSFMSHLVPK